MQQVAEFAKIGLIVGGVLGAMLLVLLAMPQSRLRDFLRPIVGVLLALACGAYVISPVDALPEIALGPFGLIDDACALVAGIASARMAIRGGKD